MGNYPYHSFIMYLMGKIINVKACVEINEIVISENHFNKISQ